MKGVSRDNYENVNKLSFAKVQKKSCKNFFYRIFSYTVPNKGNGLPQNESIIALKSATFNAAPPIKPPSTSGFAKSSFAFVGLQLPP